MVLALLQPQRLHSSFRRRFASELSPSLVTPLPSVKKRDGSTSEGEPSGVEAEGGRAQTSRRSGRDAVFVILGPGRRLGRLHGRPVQPRQARRCCCCPSSAAWRSALSKARWKTWATREPTHHNRATVSPSAAESAVEAAAAERRRRQRRRRQMRLKMRRWQWRGLPPTPRRPQRSS